MSASKERKKRQEKWAGVKQNRERSEEKKNRMIKLWTKVICAVLVVACLVLAIWSSGVFPKNATAVTIGDQSYSAGVVQFYYQSVYKQFLNSYGSQASLFGLDTSKPLDEQVYDKEKGITWADYFKEQGLEKMEKTIIVANEAKKANVSLTDESKAQIEDLKKSVTEYCVNRNLSKSAYFSYFGSGVTESLYYEQVANSLLAEDYTNYLMDQMKYTEADLASYYNENKKDFDVVSYRFFLVDGSAPTATDEEGNQVEASEAETKAAMAAASGKADQMLAKLKAGGDFTALAKELAPAEEQANYSDAASTTISDMNYANISSYPYADWLFDAARKAGDVTKVEASNGYYIIKFVSRSRNEYKTVNMRQIQIDAAVTSGADAPTDAQMAAAKTEAENVLKEWKSGDATENSFASIAKEYSDDADTKENGGLYQQVYKSSASSAVTSWLFGAQHNPGDTTIAETSSGYAILYFGSYDEVYWKLQVANAKKTKEYDAWYEKIKANYPVKENSFGMYFVV